MDNFWPAIYPRNVNKKTTNPVIIDFSACQAISSHGCCLLLQRLLRLKQVYDIPRSLNTVPSNLRPAVNAIGFFALLPDAGARTGRSMLDQLSFDLSQNPENSIKASSKTASETRISFPIKKIPLSQYQQRRVAVDQFIEHLVREMDPIDNEYETYLPDFIQIIWEIARNAADHADGDAYFGLDIDQGENGSILRFALTDQGPGIFKTVSKYQLEKHGVERYRKRGLCESYNLAVQLGYTTKPRSGINHGLGLNQICEGSRQIGMSLTILDAQSIGSVERLSSMTVRALRSQFRDVGVKIGFAYTGILPLKKRS